jgi:spore maturation protein CgeB
VISDRWDGLHAFFADQQEILVADTADDVLAHLDAVDGARRAAIGGAARRRVLAEHTAAHRVEQLEAMAAEVVGEGVRA